MASASRQSRRVLEVRGVSLSALKNHPTLEESEMTIKCRPITAKSQSSSLLSNSSFSSSADDFDLDRESNELTQQMFIDIDSLLYDERLPAECKEDIIDECCLWKEKHPHYRITGQQILPESEDGFLLLPQYPSVGSLPTCSDSPLTDSSKLFVEGFQMELNSPSVYNFCSISDEMGAIKQSISTEEIIATTGSYEETIASDGQKDAEMPNSAETKNVNVMKNLTDEVMHVLTDKFYCDVTHWLQKLIRSYVGFVRSEMYQYEKFHNENSKFTNFPNLRLSTAPPRNSFNSDVEGILTISPSRLQLRADKSSSLPSTALSPYSKQHTNLTPNSSVPLKKLQAAMRLIPLEKKVFREREIKLTSSASNPAYTRSNILPPIQTPDDSRTQSKGKSLRPSTLSSHSRTRIDYKLKSTKEELPINKNSDANK